jgi:hypothetical protein
MPNSLAEMVQKEKCSGPTAALRRTGRRKKSLPQVRPNQLGFSRPSLGRLNPNWLFVNGYRELIAKPLFVCSQSVSGAFVCFVSVSVPNRARGLEYIVTE